MPTFRRTLGRRVRGLSTTEEPNGSGNQYHRSRSWLARPHGKAASNGEGQGTDRTVSARGWRNLPALVPNDRTVHVPPILLLRCQRVQVPPVSV